jgi:hypothetical protein
MRWATLFLLALILAPSASAQTITARIDAHRTSGAAPLYVFFYATGTPEGGLSTSCTGSTLCSYVYRNLDFDWDFADPAAGVWANGTNEVGLARSRNEATGPVAAHLFRTAGTYDVVLTVRGPLGGVATQTVQITVTSESSQWPGTQTTCIGNTLPTAGSGGCPAGAGVMTASTMAAINATCNVTDHRCLLRAGDTFTGGNFLLAANGPSMIGAFGTANAGRWTLVVSQNAHGFDVNGKCDWRIGGVAFTTTNTDTDAQAMIQGGCRPTGGVGNVYFDNTNINGGKPRFRNAINASCKALDPLGVDIFGPMGAFDNEWDGIGRKAITGDGQGGNIVFYCGRRLAIMGNRLYDSTQAEHNARFEHFEGLVFSHNSTGAPAVNKGSIILRSRPTNLSAPDNAGGLCSAGCGRPSRDAVVSFNYVLPNEFGGSTSGTGASNGSKDDPQGQDFIIESNFFDDFPGLSLNNGASTVTDTTRYTFRNNVRFSAGLREFQGLNYSANDLGQGATDVAAYNNTFYYRADTGTVSGTAITTGSTVRAIRAGGNIVTNNLLYAPLSTGTRQVWEGQTNGGDGVAGNDIASANPFAVAPDVFSEFALKSGAPQINAGVTTLPVYRDVTGAFRTGAPDVGAFEFGSVVDPPDQCIPADCDDSNQCTDGTCDDGTCTQTPRTGQSCDDGNAATAGDVCLANLTCQGTASMCTPTDCEDGNPCTTGTCTASTCSQANVANGLACDDGDANTSSDQCQTGVCQGTPSGTTLAVSKLVAYRVDTDAVLYDPFTGGAAQPLDLTPGFALQAVVTGGTPGSVRFILGGNVTGTEGIAPYAQNDDGGNYRQYEEITSPGVYTLTSVTPYTGAGASGIAGTALTSIELMVTDSSIVPPSAPTIFIRGASGGVLIP